MGGYFIGDAGLELLKVNDAIQSELNFVLKQGRAQGPSPKHVGSKGPTCISLPTLVIDVESLL